MKVRGRRPWLLSHIHTPGGGREHQIHSCGRLKKLQHHTSVWGAGLLKLVAPLISPYSNSEIKGELLSDGERETLLLHTFFFPSPSMYSSVTPQITPHYFTPLYFTSFSPIYIPLSPGSLSSSSPHPSLPPSLSGERRTWIVNLGVMELWQADPSALSPGHAAVPWLCDAYLPKHTSTQKLAGIHPPTHMHAYIYRATEGAHMCTYLHLHILIEHMCMCACAALYKWSHFCAGPRMCGRNKECQVLGNHRLEDFSGPIPISILKFDGFFCRFMCVCVLLLQKFADKTWHPPRTSSVELNIILHSGRRLAQLVERASHVQRLCPRCSGPRFESQPEALCCVSLPPSHPDSCCHLSCSLNNA